MTWVAVLLGIALTAFGATAGAALITVSRAELTRAVGRRLRGAAPSLTGLAQIDYYLTAASATTSLGVLLLGGAVPGLLAGSGAPRLVVAVALLAVPLVLFAAYLVPRWLTQPRAQSVADRVIPIPVPGHEYLACCFPRATPRGQRISGPSGVKALPSVLLTTMS
jgi:CBS domain containing-hemolysin-like protein